MPVYVSDRLTATLGVVRGSPTPTRLIQWFRGSTVISGANASTYTITSDDLGQPISVRQTESNYFGSAVATSAATEDVEVFSPSILFSASEPGVWFDPTDAANLAWRRNLLLYSQQFPNAVWVKYQSAVTVNAATAPDSTTTATKLVPAAGLAPGFIYYNVAIIFPVGTVTTTSVYVKAAELGFAFIANNNNGSSTASGVCINLTTGALTNQGGSGTYSAVSVGNGWWRVSVTSTTTTTFNSPEVSPLAAAGSYATYTGDGTSGIYIWGAQQELGSVATTYQPITDLNTEVIAQFPNATLYQDSIGTIPVYAPEQPVGLMLDKSRGLVLGPEIITNGNFSGGSTGWTAGTTPINWTFAGGAINGVDASGGYQNVGQVISGKSYVAEFTISGWTAGSVSLENAGAGAFGAVFSGDGVKRQFFTAAATATIGFVRRVSNFTGSIDNFSVKELPGNHATQSTAISRPLYGIVPVSGRRNLLVQSEQFNTSWSTAQLTLAAGATAAPNGTLTAYRVTPSAGTVSKAIYQDFAIGATSTQSIYVKLESGARYFQLLWNGVLAFANFDLVGKVVGSTGGGVTGSTITELANGWFRLTATNTNAAGSGLWLYVVDDATATYSPATSSVGTFFIWGAQLETGPTATAYQKVTNTYDVTEAGVASVGYLRFDGTNDFMVTSTITPGTNKVQIFSGVRKLGEATLGMLAELSAGSGNGLFFLSAPRNTSTASYSFYNQGTTGVDVVTAGSFPTPITNILTALGDISADSTILRANSVQVGQSSTDLGTGNYLAHPLYLGRRGGITFEFNGQMFPMIVRFGPNMSSALIRTTENWVASKTAGVVLP